MSFLKVACSTPVSLRVPVQDAISAARAVAKGAIAAIRSIASSSKDSIVGGYELQQFRNVPTHSPALR